MTAYVTNRCIKYNDSPDQVLKHELEDPPPPLQTRTMRYTTMIPSQNPSVMIEA